MTTSIIAKLTLRGLTKALFQFFELTAGDLIGFDANGQFINVPAGTPGADGADGNTVLNGSGAPASETGVNGDFYIDTAVWDIYGPKASGTWPSGVSLIGPPA